MLLYVKVDFFLVGGHVFVSLFLFIGAGQEKQGDKLKER